MAEFGNVGAANQRQAVPMEVHAAPPPPQQEQIQQFGAFGNRAVERGEPPPPRQNRFREMWQRFIGLFRRRPLENRRVEARLPDGHARVLPNTLGRFYNRAARRAFENAVIQPNFGEGIAAITSLGICRQAEGDWRRGWHVTIGDQHFDPGVGNPEDRVAQTATALDGLVGGDQHLKQLVSQFANQGTFFPLSQAMQRGDIVTSNGFILPANIYGNSRHPIFSCRITSDGNGGVNIGFSIHKSYEQINGEDVDPTQNFYSATWGLHIGPAPDYRVSVGDTLRYDALFAVDPRPPE